jgi:hypothetical protein
MWAPVACPDRCRRKPGGRAGWRCVRDTVPGQVRPAAWRPELAERNAASRPARRIAGRPGLLAGAPCRPGRRRRCLGEAEDLAVVDQIPTATVVTFGRWIVCWTRRWPWRQIGSGRPDEPSSEPARPAGHLLSYNHGA